MENFGIWKLESMDSSNDLLHYTSQNVSPSALQPVTLDQPPTSHDQSLMSNITPDLQSFEQSRTNSPVIMNGLQFSNIVPADKTRSSIPTIASLTPIAISTCSLYPDIILPDTAVPRCVVTSCSNHKLSFRPASKDDIVLRKQAVDHFQTDHTVTQITDAASPSTLSKFYNTSLCPKCTKFCPINANGQIRSHKFCKPEFDSAKQLLSFYPSKKADCPPKVASTYVPYVFSQVAYPLLDPKNPHSSNSSIVLSPSAYESVLNIVPNSIPKPQSTINNTTINDVVNDDPISVRISTPTTLSQCNSYDMPDHQSSTINLIDSEVYTSYNYEDLTSSSPHTSNTSPSTSTLSRMNFVQSLTSEITNTTPVVINSSSSSCDSSILQPVIPPILSVITQQPNSPDLISNTVPAPPPQNQLILHLPDVPPVIDVPVVQMLPLGPTPDPALDPTRFDHFTRLNIPQFVITVMEEITNLAPDHILATKVVTTQFLARNSKRNLEKLIFIYDTFFQSFLAISENNLPIDDILCAIWLLPRLLFQIQQMYPGIKTAPMSLATRIETLINGDARSLVRAAFGNDYPTVKPPQFIKVSDQERKKFIAKGVHKALSNALPGVAASIAVSTASHVQLPKECAIPFLQKMFCQPQHHTLLYPAEMINGNLGLIDYTSLTPAVTLDNVSMAIMSIKKAVTPGNSGLRGEHLQAIWEEGKPSTQQGIVLVLSLMVQNKLPRRARSLFSSSIMTTVTKPVDDVPSKSIILDDLGVPTNIRPIQCMDTWLKVAEASILPVLQEAFRELAKAESCYGMGTKGGTEIVVHQIKMIYHFTGHYILADDFSNFYGSIEHQTIINACVDMGFQSILPLFTFMYSDPQLLFTVVKTDDGLLMAVNGQVNGGGFQGSTLMCMVANVVMAFISKKTKKALSIRFPLIDQNNIVIPSYIDDTYLAAPPDDLINVHKVWTDVSRSILKNPQPLNINKCQILPALNAPIISPEYLLALNATYGPGVNIRVVEAMKVCGAVIGSGQNFHDLMHEKVSKINSVPNALMENLESIQDKYLTFANTPGRSVYMIRVTPPLEMAPYAKVIDAETKAFVTNLLNLKPEELTPVTFTKVFESRKNGGLGITNTESISLFAYLASMAQSMATLKTYYADKPNSILSSIITRVIQCTDDILRDNADILAKPLDHWGPPDHLFALSVPISFQLAKAIYELRALHFQVEGATKHAQSPIVWSFSFFVQNPEKLQRFATSLLKQAIQIDMIPHLTAVQRAQQLSMIQEGGGNFLQAFPSEPALCFPNAQLQIVLRGRVLLPNPASLPPADKCSGCGLFMDSPTSHSKGCKKGSGDKIRHDWFVRLIRTMLTAAGLVVSRFEPRPVSNESNKRADISFIADNFTTVHADVHIINESSNQNIRDLKSDQIPLSAAHAGFSKKIKHHQRDHMNAGITFLPLVVEVSGAMHPGVIDLVTYCAKIFAANHPGLIPSYVTSYCPNFKRYWLMRLSVVNFFGTANAMLHYKRRPLNAQHQSASVFRTSSDYRHPFRQFVKRPDRR